MNVTGYEGRVPGLNDNQWSGKLILRDYGDGEQAALRQGEPREGMEGPAEAVPQRVTERNVSEAE